MAGDKKKPGGAPPAGDDAPDAPPWDAWSPQPGPAKKRAPGAKRRAADRRPPDISGAPPERPERSEEQPREAKQPNYDAVAAAIRDDASPDANRAEALLSLGAGDPRPGAAIDGIRPGEWQADEFGLPPGCPVLPLGTEEGIYFFLDTIGQMRAFKGGDLGQAGIRELFMGRHLWLYWAFPRTNAAGNVTSWRPEKAAEALMAACARKGTWNAVYRVRGRGAWRGRDGRLVLHCGDRLTSTRGDEDLGEMEGFVYPTRPPIPRPWPVSLAGKPGPALRLLPHFSSWHWARPQLDPLLVLAWIGVACLGGALANRPASYVTGGRGTGKSALHGDIKALMGEWLVNTGDTSSAGIYQLMKFDCLGVAVDEFEAKADTRKTKAVIELMRLSYTGAPMLRGGDSHKGTQFHGRSAFNFSSINMPPMEPQDLSRLAALRLLKLPPEAVKPMIAEEEMAELGRKLLRRLLDEWHRFAATLEAWRRFLASCGHDGRGQDTFGTLMAVADLVIAHDAIALDLELGPNAVDGEHPFESWRETFEAEKLAETADSVDNDRLCLDHLLSKRIEAWRGGSRHTVGEVLTEFWEADHAAEGTIGYEPARKLLEQTGLTMLKPTAKGGHFELFVPINNPLLYEVFRDSKWSGELGAGAWTGALRQAEDFSWREASARINGRKFKGTAFALGDIIVSEEAARS